MESDGAFAVGEACLNDCSSVNYAGAAETGGVGSNHPPSWERLAFWLVASVIGLQLLADVLPRVVLPIVVLGGVFVVVRLVLFHTRRW